MDKIAHFTLIISAYLLSLLRLVSSNILWKRKDVGVNFPLLIPRTGSRIALSQDKQLSQPTPLRII